MDASAMTPAELAGSWTVTVKSPTGPMPSTLEIEHVEGRLSGTQTGDGTATPIDEILLDGDKVVWKSKISKPMQLKLEFAGVVDGDTINGKVKAGFMGSFPFTAVRAS